MLNLRKLYTIAPRVYKFISSCQGTNEKFRGWETNSLVSTHVLCTEAMAQYFISLDHYSPKLENMFIDFHTNNTKQTLHIKPENEIVQSLETPANTKDFIFMKKFKNYLKILTVN